LSVSGFSISIAVAAAQPVSGIPAGGPASAGGSGGGGGGPKSERSLAGSLSDSALVPTGPSPQHSPALVALNAAPSTTSAIAGVPAPLPSAAASRPNAVPSPPPPPFISL